MQFDAADGRCNTMLALLKMAKKGGARGHSRGEATMTEQKAKWDQPRVLQISDLPAGLGACADGNTPLATSCEGGQQPVIQADSCSTGSLPSRSVCEFGSRVVFV